MPCSRREREAKAAFGKDEVYLEKLVRRARHVEVQVLGDAHGNLVHLFERDCSIQRRNQKVIERAPAPYLDPAVRQALCDAALKIARGTDYVGAGTVEFLLDVDSGKFYFIEVNPRIQVEHTVTEVVCDLDIVKAQIRIAEGKRIGVMDADGAYETGIPPQDQIATRGHALQCRITTENPENNFIPDYGRIIAYRGAVGFGIRIDGGTAYSGAVVTRFYDPLLEKVTAWAATPQEAIARMDRALREYRIRGVATNLAFLEAVLSHPKFRANDYTTRFIDETPELFHLPARRDRATKLLTYIADVTVNGHPETRGRARSRRPMRASPKRPISRSAAQGRRQAIVRQDGRGEIRGLDEGAKRRCWSPTPPCATRINRCSPPACAPTTSPASLRPMPTACRNLLSLECWGGATFDVAMRFLNEDPWERLAKIRERVPNLLLQMLLRGANGVGYTNYPDNVVKAFVRRTAEAGMDLFRIFDCLNWVENMRVAIDAVLRSGQAGGRGDLLYRRHVRSGPRQIRPGLLRRRWRRSWRRPAVISWRSRTWRAC